MRASIINSGLVACAVLLASGCGKPSPTSLVVVSVDADAPVADVATLHARVTVGEQTRDFDVHPTGGAAQSIPPAQTFGINLPRAMTGQLLVHVEARDSSGLTTASGDGSGTIRVGARADVSVHMTASIVTSTVDMAMAATMDMATPPADLAPGGDMVVIPPAMLTIDKTSQSFGDITVGKTSTTASFLVVNAGGLNSGVATLSTGGANASEFAIDTDCGPALPPGGRCHVTASLTPTSAGTKQATFTLTATPGGALTATLTANALTPGAVKIVQPSGNCGSSLVGTESTMTATFTVQNGGASPTGALTVATSDPQFTATGCSGMTLAANATCTVTVKFKPSTSGTQNASLSVTASPGGTDTASLVGVGLKPASFALAPAMYTFAGTARGANGDTGVFTISNQGDVAAPTLSAATVTGANPTSFVVTADNCNNVALGPAPASCTISVQFRPQVTGANGATLVVSAGAATVASAPLAGTGLAPASLKITPSTATLSKGGAATFTVSNDGDVASGALSVAAIGGANASSFSVTADNCKGTSVGPAPASCTITVQESPMSTGTQNATLSLSASPGGSVSATLSGPGLNPASLRVAPDHYAFASSPRGTPGATATFTVYNDGEVASATMSPASVSGGNQASFAITADNCKNAPLGPAPASCTIAVQFTPQVTGANGASLNVNVAGATLLSAPLTGTGTPIWVREAGGTPNALNAVWGADATHVWAAGDASTILFSTGNGTWTAWTVDSSTPQNFAALWGTGPYDIWAGSDVGMLRSVGDGKFSGAFAPSAMKPITGIWGTSAADVWVAAAPMVWHLTNQWSSETVSNGAQYVWGSSTTDVYTAGSDVECGLGACQSIPVVFHRDSSTRKWTEQYHGVSVPSGGTSLSGLWGSGPSDIFVGTWQRPLHSTGNGAWTAIDPAAPKNVSAIWGTGPTDVWLVSGVGISHYDGSTTAAAYAPNSFGGSGVWGTSDGAHVYVVGADRDGNCIYHRY